MLLLIVSVFEARYSEMEWMITKNVDKDGATENEGEFVSFFCFLFFLKSYTVVFLYLRIIGDIGKDNGTGPVLIELPLNLIFQQH